MINYADPNQIPLPQSIWARLAVWLARNTAAIFIAFLVGGGTLALTFAAFRSPLLAGAATLAVIVLSMILARAIIANRRARAMLIVEYMEQAVRLGMPLPEMLQASALAERWPIRKRLERLAVAIAAGAPIDDAVRKSVPEMPRRAVALMACAARTNTLVPTLSRIVQQERHTFGHDVFRSAFQRIYLLLTIILVCGGITMFSVFVLPKFEVICRDFRIELPWQTQVIRVAAVTFAPTVFVLSALAAFWVYTDAWHVTFDARTRRSDFLRDARDWIWWNLPFARAATRDQGLADACDALAAALDVGMPLPTAVLEAATVQTNQVLRNRLIHWSQLLAYGADVAQSAREARLPALVVGMLAPGVASASLADVFRFLARHYASRAQRALAFLRAASVPAIALLAGGAALLLALAIMKPLIVMIERVVPYTRPF